MHSLNADTLLLVGLSSYRLIGCAPAYSWPYSHPLQDLLSSSALFYGVGRLIDSVRDEAGRQRKLHKRQSPLPLMPFDLTSTTSTNPPLDITQNISSQILRKMQLSAFLIFAATCLGMASAAAMPEAPVSAITETSVATIPDSIDSIDSNLEKRACFKSGATFGNDRGTALTRARSVCNGFLSRTYRRGTGFVMCQNLSDNKHVVFTVRLSGPNAPLSRDLGASECYGGLSSEINSCGRGGQTTYGRWYYRYVVWIYFYAAVAFEVHN